MSRRARMGLFAVSAAGLAALLLWSVAGLPDFGHYRGPYGKVLNSVVLGERHTTNVVAAAICVEEGLFTTNGLNAVLVALLLALLGAALATATARAIRLRDRGTLESTPAERERA